MRARGHLSAFERLLGRSCAPGAYNPDWALFSANSFIAAVLATYVAFRLGLQRPYWAMMTVYMTAQPLAGALRSKAAFRLFGTIIGAAAAVGFVPVLADEPLLLCIAITAFSSLCLFISLQDRTPRSYAFMLAGYTATTVAFASATAPDAVFDTALARVEEIVLGICCATVVHSLVFPKDVTSVILKRARSSIDDAGAWVAGALRGTGDEGEKIARRRLASDVTELEMLSVHMPFDTAVARPRVWAIHAFQDSLALVLPLLAAIEDRMTALREANLPTAEVDELSKTVAAWADDPAASQHTPAGLTQKCDDLIRKLLPTRAGDWGNLLAFSAVSKLRSLVEALDRSHRLSRIVCAASDAELINDFVPERHRARRSLHTDSGLAALAIVSLFVAVLGCCGLWILSSWPEGMVAAEMAAVYVAFYAGLDDAAPTLVSFTIWTVASLPIAALYLFVVFPAIDGFPMLTTSLAPTLLVMGYLQADPRHNLKALALLIGFIAGLDVQNRWTADFASFVNANSAEVVGILAAFIAIRAVRSASASKVAGRLLRHGWTDLATLASTRRHMDRERWLGVMLDRLGLVAPRLALAGRDVATKTGQSLTALQLGLDLIDLRSSIGQTESRAALAAADVLSALAPIFKQCANDVAIGIREYDNALIAIDHAISTFARPDAGDLRGSALTALVGLRRTQFPDAKPITAERMVA